MEQPERPPKTVSPYQVRLSGLMHQADAERLEHAITSLVDEFSKYIDLSGLDGITVSEDYAAALHSIDLGYRPENMPETLSKAVVGCAMAPRVLRGGVLKSHIIIILQYVVALLLPEHELYQNAVYLLAHECSHVAITQTYENAFPNVLLRKSLSEFRNLQESNDAAISFLAWEEYAANRMSSGFRHKDLIDHNADILIACTSENRIRADSEIVSYRLHRDLETVYRRVSDIYGDLIIKSAYLIGTLAGADETIEGQTWFVDLRVSWFWPFMKHIEEAFESIWNNYGEWKSQNDFEPIVNVLHDVIVSGGIHVTRITETDLWLDIP